ncbi:hypothetical protein C8R46DRAFT_1089458 [Mycena filopes]|nr:hypothetical protein C8R46DRAFT_1089458 [Mycena filopes]
MASLDALPDHILSEILKYFVRDRDKVIPRYFRKLTSLATLSRRFFEIASPYLFAEVRVPSCTRLPDMLCCFRRRLSFITSIRVGHSPLSRVGVVRCPDSEFPPGLHFSDLQNLVHFDFLGFPFCPKRLLEMFGPSRPKIRSLTLGWSSDHVFPFEVFPSLENLSLLINPGQPPLACEPLSCGSPPIVFPTLTTLSIIDNMLWFDSKICGRATFPNLRAFYLRPHSKFRHKRLFGFISDHPTLLDVSIPELYVGFPDLVKLARGERNSSWNVELPVDPNRLARIEVPALSAVDHIDFAKWNGLEVSSFSFVRAAHAVPPILHNLAQLTLETSPDGASFFLKDIGGLGEFPLLAECTRLSLVISESANEEDLDAESLMSIIVNLAFSPHPS